jgi:hypothetical protein
MELARVEFCSPPGTVTAVLTRAGWSVANDAEVGRQQGLERILNLIFSISKFSPEDGDPVAHAAQSAAAALEGTVTFIRPCVEAT